MCLMMKRSEFTTSLIVFLAIIYAPVLSYLVSGSSAYFKFFAADTFYYLTIAANTSWSTIASFDGTYPTNGFHPLWQFLLKIIFSGFDDISQPQQISITFWLSVFLVGISGSIIAYALKKTEIINSTWLIFLALSPGFLYFFLALPNPNYGNLWSYVNGMESPLSLFLFSLLFLFVVSCKKSFETISTSNYLFAGLVTSLIILTRLDDVFIVIGLAVPILLSNQGVQEKLKRCIYFGFIPTLLICCYLFLNNHYADSALPISGQIKNGEAYIENILQLVNGFFPYKIIDSNDWGRWGGYTWRVLHNLLPLTIAAIYLVFYFRNYKKTSGNYYSRYNSFLAGLATYVILKGLYNFMFVHFTHQGHWYYAISILVANIIVARFLYIFIKNKTTGFADLTISSPYFLFISVLVALLVGNSILNEKAKSRYNLAYENLFNNRLNVRTALQDLDPDFKLLSFDDGIISYSLQIPTMSGLGFALDKEAFTAKTKGKFLDIAYKRGYRWLTSFIYMPRFEAKVGDDVSSYIKKAFWRPSRLELKKYRFHLVYIDPITNLKVISFEPVK